MTKIDSPPPSQKNPQKTKKQKQKEKKFLMFQEMELFELNLKTFLIFSQSFSYISRNETLHFQTKAQNIKNIQPPKNCLYYREWNFLAPRLKNSSYFRKWNFLTLILKNLSYFLKSCSYISGNGNPEKEFLIFQQMQLSSISGNGNAKKRPELEK